MIATLSRLGFRRGVLGGSRGFMILWMVAMAVRLLKRMGGSEPEVVYSEKLEPGTSLLLTHEAPR